MHACMHSEIGETMRNNSRGKMLNANTGFDPLEVLGQDLMMRCLGFLDANSLALSLLVSRSWFSLSFSDLLWSPLCEQLWVGKAHIPRRSKLPGLSKLACYSRAVIDSKRVRITRDDLCDHAWNFHFTEATSNVLLISSLDNGRLSRDGESNGFQNSNQTAPAYWRNIDPYWTSEGPLLRRYFHQDGSISADPGDKVWGGHESMYTVVTSITVDGGITRDNYVRVNRWPKMRVSRRRDWGWNLSNVIVRYSSIPDADKESGTGPMY